MKKQWFQKILTILLSAICLITVMPAEAAVGKTDHTTYDYTQTAGWPEAPEITAKSAYMIELNSGAVLYNKNGEERSFPASTTKIMTGLLALENLDLEQKITFSRDSIYDIESGGNHWEFQEGEVLTVDQCLQFLLVESVNEAAYALAEEMDGTLAAFSERMNERAKELGAVSTTFMNPHGLNNPEHKTTAKDLAMILWGCVDNDKFIEYASIPSISLKGKKIMKDGFSTYYNHDKMLLPESVYYDEDVVCGKTGYTSLAGSTLVTYARRGDMDLVCVILQGTDDRWTDTTALLDYAFDNFQLISAQDALGEKMGGSGYSFPLEMVPVDNCSILIPKDADAADLTSEFKLMPEDETVLGQTTWYYQGMTAATTRVTLGETAEEGAAAAQGTVTESEASSQDASSEAQTEAAETVPEPEPKEWNIREYVAFGILGVLILFLLGMIIGLIRRRIRQARKAKRRRRRRYARTSQGSASGENRPNHRKKMDE